MTTWEYAEMQVIANRGQWVVMGSPPDNLQSGSGPASPRPGGGLLNFDLLGDTSDDPGEIKSVTKRRADVQATLAWAGQEGWELVAATAEGDYSSWHFKRPLSDWPGYSVHRISRRKRRERRR